MNDKVKLIGAKNPLNDLKNVKTPLKEYLGKEFFDHSTFEQREQPLRVAGLEITFEELKNMYI